MLDIYVGTENISQRDGNAACYLHEPFGGPDMVPFIARMWDCIIEMVPTVYYGTLMPVLSTLVDNPRSSTGCC